MYHQQPRGRGRGRGSRGASRGQGAHSQGRSSFGVLGGRVTVAPYQVSLPAAPHPLNAGWLDRAADAWDDGGTSLPSVLWDAFNSTSQPYLRLLDLVIFSPDYSKNRPDGLTATVLRQFRSWLQDYYGDVQNVPPGVLNDKVRLLAFKAVSGQECSFISDIIVELCDLTRSALMFVDDVNRILQAKDYKKACQMATRLRLHGQFGVGDFVTPLVLLDRANVAEAYLAEDGALQMAAVTALDDLLDRSLPVAASNLGMPSFAKDSVNQKTLKKLIERWCKRFGLDVRRAAPNTALHSARATMNYLFYRRFRERSIKRDDCEDFLLDILADYPELMQDALDRLNREDALETLYNVALTLAVPSREMPFEQETLLFRPDDAVDADQAGCSPPRPSTDFYRMPGHVRVQLIDRVIQLPSVTRDLQEYKGPLGLDAEWKPISVRDVNAVSLLQVAMKSIVYVFDVAQLGSSRQMEDLGMAVLCGSNLKLGFDLVSDFDMLEASVPSFGKAIMNRKNIMDVRILGNRVEAAFPDVFPFKEAPSAQSREANGGGDRRGKPKEAVKGLSELVRKCTGRPLDKDEQCSNWNRRPLRPTQLQYAATDAHCLVEVYEVLRRRLSSQHGTTPQEVIKCIITSAAPGAGDGAGKGGAGKKAGQSPGRQKQKKAAPATPRAEVAIENAPPSTHAIRPDAFKAVCDTMVQGLGKRLRSIGADAVILENGEDHDLCVTYARREGRVILTRGRQLHRRMAGLVGPGLCYRVDSERAPDQLEEVVRQFRIDVAPDDVFKRCQYCNCSDYWRVPTAVMRRLRDRLHVDGPAVEEHVPLEAEGDAQVDLNSGHVRYTTVYVDCVHLHTTTLDSTETFYVCQACGHVYWAGSHHGKYVASLGNIVGGGQQGGACGGSSPRKTAPARAGRPPMVMACDSDDSDEYFY